jgi:hypothetical protein
LTDGEGSLYEEEPGIQFDAKEHLLQMCWTVRGDDDFRQALDDMCMGLNELAEQGAPIEVTFYDTEFDEEEAPAEAQSRDDFLMLFVGPNPAAIMQVQRDLLVQDVINMMERHFDGAELGGVVQEIDNCSRSALKPWSARWSWASRRVVDRGLGLRSWRQSPPAPSALIPSVIRCQSPLCCSPETVAEGLSFVMKPIPTPKYSGAVTQQLRKDRLRAQHGQNECIVPLALPYLSGYAPSLQNQVRDWLLAGKAGEWLLRKYPQAHAVRTDRALYDYVDALKAAISAQCGAVAQGGLRQQDSCGAQCLGLHAACDCAWRQAQCPARDSCGGHVQAGTRCFCA